MQYLFNITFNIQFEAVDAWLPYMKSKAIPELRKSFEINDLKLLKLLTELDNGGVTYSLQFMGDAKGSFPQQIDAIESQLNQMMTQEFTGQHVMFSTLLREETL